MESRTIAISWKPSNYKSGELYNINLNTQVRLHLGITPQCTTPFFVVLKSKSSWLQLSRRSGKPPFTVLVTVDTTGLDEATGYKEMLEFWSGGEVIHYEPIYLTTRVYEKQQLQTQPFRFPLEAGKPRRNIFWIVIDGLLVIYHLILTFVYLWIGLVLLMLIVVVLIGIVSG